MTFNIFISRRDISQNHKRGGARSEVPNGLERSFLREDEGPGRAKLKVWLRLLSSSLSKAAGELRIAGLNQIAVFRSCLRFSVGPICMLVGMDLVESSAIGEMRILRFLPAAKDFIDGE
jgi:hypothetical protein